MKPSDQILNILQFILSLMAALMYFALAVVMLLLSTSGMLAELTGNPPADNTSSLLWAAGFGLFGLLVLPSAWFAWRSWTGHPYQGFKPSQQLSFSKVTFFLLVIVYPLALVAGHLASQHLWTTATLLPAFHVLAVGIPILWLGMIGLRGLPVGSPQRASGVFASGLAVSPIVSITLEIMAAIAIFIAAVFALSLDPEIVLQIENLSLLLIETNDPNQVIEQFQPLLANPWVISGIVLLIAVITPLVEETFKPIGVYLLLHRRISPAEGFAAGLLNGLGFALFESLLISSGSQDWLSIVLMRVPTAALHGFTTALVGYGLASAASQRRYLRLVGCFVFAVFLHGIWNGLTLVSVGYEIQAMLTQAEASLPIYVQLIPLSLIFLAGLSFLGIILLNRRLNTPQVNPDL